MGRRSSLTGSDSAATASSTLSARTVDRRQAEFAATAGVFFAQPQIGVRGWESAADAQARIVRSIEEIISQIADDDDVAIVGHGGTGNFALLSSRRVADRSAF